MAMAVEVSGMVSRSVPGSTMMIPMPPMSSRKLVRFSPFRKLNKLNFAAASTFSDNGHLDYYYRNNNNNNNSYGGYSRERRTQVTAVAELPAKEKKMKMKTKKNKLKLLKGLSDNLTAFSEIGFGLDPDQADPVKGQINLSEAADVLLEQLQQLRAAGEMEVKKKKKEKKNKQDKAALLRLKNMTTMEEEEEESTCSSSSESSSSSDSDCEENTARLIMKKDNNSTTTTPATACSTGSIVIGDVQQRTDNTTMTLEAAAVANNNVVVPVAAEIVSMIGQQQQQQQQQEHQHQFQQPVIEVCMGGKCKKSGAAMLMSEFEKTIGDQGTVVGCKCMGKCRDGPNVRVSQAAATTGGAVVSNKNPPLPLCIGVGLEDVGLIVANMFEFPRQVPAASS